MLARKSPQLRTNTSENAVCHALLGKGKVHHRKGHEGPEVGVEV